MLLSFIAAKVYEDLIKSNRREDVRKTQKVYKVISPAGTV